MLGFIFSQNNSSGYKPISSAPPWRFVAGLKQHPLVAFDLILRVIVGETAPSHETK